MALFSGQTEELYAYKPELTKRADFDHFWAETLQEAKGQPLECILTPHPYPGDGVKVYEVTYKGFGGTQIYGWYLEPVFTGNERHPCLIKFHGLHGSRELPVNHMAWCMMGLAVLAIDIRGQGGLTRDDAVYHSGYNGELVLNGILSKDEYYFRNVYMDCVRAVDCAEQIRTVDPKRLILEGGSQGGALVSAVSALDNRAYLALPDVPSNSNLEAWVKNRAGSFGAVSDFIRRRPMHIDRALETLSYFDTMNLADRVTCPVYASVGLMDPVCPPLHYFATYNRIQAEKQIELYPFAEHEGGASLHLEKKMRYVYERLQLG